MIQTPIVFGPISPIVQPPKGSVRLVSDLDRFYRFHNLNPHVLDLLIQGARSLERSGWAKCSIKTLYEGLRWEAQLRTRGEQYKLNNNHHAFYSRVVMALCPDLVGFFRTRAQSSPYVIRWEALNITPEMQGKYARGELP